MSFGGSGVTELSHRASSIFKFCPGVHSAAQVPLLQAPSKVSQALLSLAARLVRAAGKGHGAEHPAQVGEAGQGKRETQDGWEGRRPQEAEVDTERSRARPALGQMTPRPGPPSLAQLRAQPRGISPAVRPQGPHGAARVHGAVHCGLPGTPVGIRDTNTDLCAHRRGSWADSGGGRKGSAS